MNEATDEREMYTVPLGKIHERLGASFREENNWRVPASYGDVLAEYAAVRDGGAGLIDLSSRARILVSGSEAVMFLNGLITNDMKRIGENLWMAAAFPSFQGRLIASVRVARLADEPANKKASPKFLLETEPATHESVLRNITRFTMAGEFYVPKSTRGTFLLSLPGKNAIEITPRDLREAGAWNS